MNNKHLHVHFLNIYIVVLIGITIELPFYRYLYIISKLLHDFMTQLLLLAIILIIEELFPCVTRRQSHLTVTNEARRAYFMQNNTKRPQT